MKRIAVWKQRRFPLKQLVILATGGFVTFLVWGARSLNSDILLQNASLLLTVILTGIGVEMANNPPRSDDEIKKWKYRGAFLLVGALLCGVNYKQSVRNQDAQDKAHQETQTAHREATDQYNYLKSQNDEMNGRLIAVNDFLRHVPPGLTQKQVAQSVHVMSYGNLKERTLNLAESLASELKKYGLPQRLESNDAQDQLAVATHMSEIFRIQYLRDVVEIRNQYFGFTFQDRNLDEILETCGATKHSSGLFEYQDDPRKKNLINPMGIIFIVQELQTLAAKIPATP